MSIKTVVQFVSSKKFNGREFWSFKGQDGAWYSTGVKKPPEKGSYIEFEAAPNDKGYLQASDIVILPSNEQAVSTGPRQAAKAVAAASKTNNKDEYWEQKAERDVEVQKRIEIQSCRNSALQFISILLTAGAIPVPKAKADQEEFFVTLLDRYTKQFIEGNKGVGVITKVEEENVDLEKGSEIKKSVEELANWS